MICSSGSPSTRRSAFPNYRAAVARSSPSWGPWRKSRDCWCWTKPFSGLDPLVRRDVLAAVIGELAEAKKTVLFVSHSMADVERLADRIAIMAAGRIVWTGDAEDARYAAGGDPLELDSAVAGTLAIAGKEASKLGRSPHFFGESFETTGFFWRGPRRQRRRRSRRFICSIGISGARRR